MAFYLRCVELHLAWLSIALHAHGVGLVLT
jgi:hypothetical protein